MRFTKNPKKDFQKIKLAIVHDDFIQFGGAEKLIFEIIKEFKRRGYEIQVYSSLISGEWKKLFDQEKILINESFLKFFPGCYRFSKLFFFFDLFSLAFQSFDFDNFDFVFSSSTRYGHNILTKPNTYHISYINSPARMIWTPRSYFRKNKLINKLISVFLSFERIKDLRSQFYSDFIITNSLNIKKRFYKFYKRNSLILNPFIELNSQKNLETQEGYFVIISRLVPWKRIDYVVEAFNELGFPLYIIGDGPQKKHLQYKSNQNIKFLGYISDDDKNEILSKSYGLIFPQDEDFGLTLIEALRYGIGIIYLNKGGAKEILKPSFGTPFSDQTNSSLIEAVLKFQDRKFDREGMVKYSENFNKDRFFERIERIIWNKV